MPDRSVLAGVVGHDDGPDDEADPAAVAEALRLAVRRLMGRLRSESAAEDLTPTGRSVIARLNADGPATIAALARGEAVRPQSMGATVAGLETAGLVRRRPDPRDGRRAVISLTAAGRRRLADSRSMRQEWLERAIAARLSPAEIATILEAVALLNRLVEP
jgi:DNA-binding MarR family transcriptional regulator